MIRIDLFQLKKKITLYYIILSYFKLRKVNSLGRNKP